MAGRRRAHRAPRLGADDPGRTAARAVRPLRLGRFRGPRGEDGKPIPLWNPKTGELDRSVVEHWKKYDLRMHLEQNWATLAPKLKGKLRAWMGDADNYFLNNAMRMLDESLKKASPPFEGKIEFSPGKGHCWMGLTEQQMMAEMAQAMKKP